MKAKDWQYTAGGVGGAHIGMFGRPRILMEGTKDPKGGGGGDDDDDDDDDETELPKDRKSLKKLISGTVNAAMKGIEVSLAKRLEKSITKTVTTAMQAVKGGGNDGDDDDDAGGDDADKGDKEKPRNKDGKYKINPEVEAALNKAKKDADEAKKIATEEKAKREKAEAKADRDEERAKLASVLSGRVRSEMLDDVVENLGKRIIRDPDTRAILWKGDKYKEPKEGEELDDNDILEFEAGVSKWLDSAKGKAYAPARGVGGGGERRPGSLGGKIKGEEIATDADVGDLISSRTTMR